MKKFCYLSLLVIFTTIATAALLFTALNTCGYSRPGINPMSNVITATTIFIFSTFFAVSIIGAIFTLFAVLIFALFRLFVMSPFASKLTIRGAAARTFLAGHGFFIITLRYTSTHLCEIFARKLNGFDYVKI
jgi:hypothetical protein